MSEISQSSDALCATKLPLEGFAEPAQVAAEEARRMVAGRAAAWHAPA